MQLNVGVARYACFVLAAGLLAASPPQLDAPLDQLVPNESHVILVTGHVRWQLPPGITLSRPLPTTITLRRAGSNLADPTSVVASVSADATGLYHFSTATDPKLSAIPDGRYDVYCQAGSTQKRCAANVALSAASTLHLDVNLGVVAIGGGAALLPRTVLFASDRAVNLFSGPPDQMFSNYDREPCPAGPCPLHIGILVADPLQAGNIASRSDHVSEADPVAATISEMRSNPDLAGATSLTIFVHGYNNGFGSAYAVASQIIANFSTSNAVLFYDWPANFGKPQKYIDDETNNAWTMQHFRKLLVALLNDPSAPPTINIVAHSMGNRVLFDAVAYLAEARVQTAPDAGTSGPCIEGGDAETDARRTGCHHIGQVVSIEPDVDSGTYYGAVPLMARAARGVTIYGSTHDNALQLSRELHGHCRAGQTFCEYDPPALDNVNGIDASIFSCDIWGHSYWSASATMQQDLKSLLQSGTMSTTGPTRPNLTRSASAANRFYFNAELNNDCQGGSS